MQSHFINPIRSLTINLSDYNISFLEWNYSKFKKWINKTRFKSQNDQIPMFSFWIGFKGFDLEFTIWRPNRFINECSISKAIFMTFGWREQKLRAWSLLVEEKWGHSSTLFRYVNEAGKMMNPKESLVVSFAKKHQPSNKKELKTSCKLERNI